MNLKGSSLIFSLIVLSFLLISALSVAAVSVTTKRSSLSTKNSNISFQVADSASEVMLREIYQVNDKNVLLPNPPTGSIDDLDELASSIGGGVTCNSSGTDDQIEGDVVAGKYVATLYENNGGTPPTFSAIDCDDIDWRTKVVKIKFQGIYRDTTRAIDVGVRPLP